MDESTGSLRPQPVWGTAGSPGREIIGSAHTSRRCERDMGLNWGQIGIGNPWKGKALHPTPIDSQFLCPRSGSELAPPGGERPCPIPSPAWNNNSESLLAASSLFPLEAWAGPGQELGSSNVFPAGTGSRASPSGVAKGQAPQEVAHSPPLRTLHPFLLWALKAGQSPPSDSPCISCGSW